MYSSLMYCSLLLLFKTVYNTPLFPGGGYRAQHEDDDGELPRRPGGRHPATARSQPQLQPLALHALVA